MYNLSDINFIKALLKRHGFSFSKSLGQNFIIDSELCPQIVGESGIDEDCCVIEIGAGIGVLTAEIAKKAKKVVALELDDRLLPVLRETLGGFDNVEILNADILKTDMKELISDRFGNSPVHVCANLPYYITTPIIMKFLEEKIPVKTMTLMVQKEAAERICAPAGSRDAGAISVAVEYYAKAERLIFVPRTSFTPSPKVDSEVIKLEVREAPPIDLDNETFFFKMVKAAFSQRRKTAQNGISSGTGIEKPKIAQALSDMGLDENIRAEKLNLDELARLANILGKF